ncbi:MAG: hypothetical protein ACE3JK_05460 [Sporolactobacillus sp.]
MEEQIQEAVYAFINAAGTVMAAFGTSPLDGLTDDKKKDLGIVGNVLQAAGNALETNISEGGDAIGNGLQAGGNTLVMYGLISLYDDDWSQRMIITGNWLQALGEAYPFSQH